MENELHQQALAQLAATPRLNFGHYPTPIEELPRLRAALAAEYGSCPRLLVKRDDYTGPGFGGNKVRKLEYLLARAQADGAEVVVTCGGEKSNHARITAALCARLGLRCILVLNAAAVRHDGLTPASLFVDELLGAEVQRVGTRAERIAAMAGVVAQLRNEGRRVAEIPLGGSVPLGALGYVRAMREATEQLAAMNAHVDYIFTTSSSGGTQSGMEVGRQLCGLADTRLIGVSPDDSSAAISAEVGRIIRGVGALLGLPAGALGEDVTVLDEYLGQGYGIPTPASTAALALLARTEGLFLDPVYTAKAMAALLDWIRLGRFGANDTVLFWHTGGQLALFYTPT